MESVSDWDSPEEILSRANDDIDRVAPLTYRDALRTAVKQRDELQAKLDAELPAMWREDIASLNECLERVERERDTLREEVARLNTLLLSVTGENQKRAEREARALEDWRELRAENDRLKASRLPDVEYARLDTMWQQLVRERDELKARLAHDEADAERIDREIACLRTQRERLARLHTLIAKADAEQAIHNEAFTERQRIVAWVRGQHARGSHDCSLSLMALDALRVVADEIERGEHER